TEALHQGSMVVSFSGVATAAARPCAAASAPGVRGLALLVLAAGRGQPLLGLVGRRVDGLLEAAQRLTEAAARLRDPLGPQDDERDNEDDHEVHGAEKTFEHDLIQERRPFHAVSSVRAGP